MGMIFKALGLMLIAIVAYLCFWPTGLSPVAWDVPEDQGLTGDFAPNDHMANARQIAVGGAEGPEDAVKGPDGYFYTGVYGGDILRLSSDLSEVSTFANTGGRPLGLEFDAAGNLIVADYVKGLISISPSGEVTVLADKAEGDSIIGYADDLDVLPDGTIWFSDASTKFHSQNVACTKAASVMEIWEGAGTGRVLRYDPATGTVETMMENLLFSNGIAYGPNGDYVLINETGKFRILRYWLNGEKAGETDIFIDNLPAYPDNINRDEAGGFFVGLVSPRSSDVDMMADKPFMRNLLWRIPGFASSATPAPYSHLIRLDAEGNVLENWQDPTGAYPDVTGAIRLEDGSILATSLVAPALAHIE